MIFLHYLNSIREYILKYRNGTEAHILYKMCVCVCVCVCECVTSWCYILDAIYDSYALCFGSKSSLSGERGGRVGKEQAFVEILLYSTHVSSILTFYLHKWEGNLISNVQMMKLKLWKGHILQG